jgi:hypothetical protein
MGEVSPLPASSVTPSHKRISTREISNTNGKKAKALRRAAREASYDRLVEYKPLKQTVVHKGPIPIPGRDYAIHLGHVEMVRTCERSLYQRLKKDMRRLPISAINAVTPARELRQAA